MNDFPKIGIVTADLIAEVNRLLTEARKAHDDGEHFGAVNWADLGVCDVEYRMSMMFPTTGPVCVVSVEEASPECGLAAWINARLDRDRFPSTYVECEW